MSIEQVQAGTFVGLIENLPSEIYHRSPGYSSSDIIRMGDSFENWAWRKKNPSQPTPDQIIGSVTHLLIEEACGGDQGLVERGVAILPEGVASPANKKWAAFAAEHPNQMYVSAEGMDMAKRMADAVLSKPDVAGFFQGGLAEASVFTLFPGTNLKVKCRPDYLRKSDGLSINFKTTSDASYDGFIKSIRDWAYDWQSAFYLEILQAHFGVHFDEIHVLVEKSKEGPCRVGVYTIDNEDLEFARAQYRQVIDKIPEYEAANLWPAPSAALQSVKLPNWARKVVSL